MEVRDREEDVLDEALAGVVRRRRRRVQVVVAGTTAPFWKP